ncbi:MAG: hypothetical protein Ta2E_02830 [Mycoplasmoidaceae bacterium]|nr:MAG: hypothetical protein Ta2E_02830 [Mycoplasmoidaceae bacterium]
MSYSLYFAPNLRLLIYSRYEGEEILDMSKQKIKLYIVNL